MKRELLYRNTDQIENHLTWLKGCINSLNTIIKEIEDEGVDIPENIAHLLCSESDFSAYVKGLIEAEAKRFKLRFWRAQVESTTPLLQKIPNWCTRVYSKTASSSYTFDWKCVALKNGRFTLSADCEERITEQYSIYIENEEQQTIKKMADDIVERLTEIEDITQIPLLLSAQMA